MKVTDLVFAIVALSVTPCFALADTIFYTDSSAWSAAIVNPKVETFSQMPWATTGTYLGTSVFLGGNQYSIPADGGPVGNENASAIFGFGSSNNSQLTLTQPTGLLEWEDFNGKIIPMTITLPKPTNAIGLSLGNFNGKTLEFAVTINGNGDGSFFEPGTLNGFSFVGAVSSSPFTSFTILAGLGTSPTVFQNIVVSPDTAPVISSLTVASMAPVPEPESYALLLAGISLIGFVAKRKTFN